MRGATSAMVAVAFAASAGALCLRESPRPTRGPKLGSPARDWWPVTGAVGAGVVALVVVLDGRRVALSLILLGTGAGAVLLAARGRARARADRRRAVVVEACEALASELRSGQPPLAALERTVPVWPELAPVAAACRLDAEVPAALRRLSATAGAEGMSEVASAWEISTRVGAGLGQSLDRVAETARAELATRRVVSAEIASAQATARMVALLPVVVLVLSQGTGAEPWRFLLDTAPGLACLGGGLLLALAGMCWIDAIVTRVGRGG